MLVFVLISFAYAQPWNATNLTAANDIYEQSRALNDLLGGLIGIGFVIVSYTIPFFITTANTGNAIAGLVSGGYISIISCIILLPLGFIGFPVFQIVLLMFAISLAVSVVIQRA